MIPTYLYLYVSSSSTITMHYQNPNPIVVRSSSHACMLFFLPAAAFLACVHAVFPSSYLFSRACFLSQKLLAFPLWPLACLQQPPNTDLWLVPSHLTLVLFVDLLGDRLEHFPKLCHLCLCLPSLLLECVHYLDYNCITDQFHTLCIGLCYMFLGFLCLCQDFCYPFLQWFHLSLPLLFLCLCGSELCL
jgi:hypothetical protein